MDKHKLGDYVLAVGIGAVAAFAARKALTTGYEMVREKPALPRPNQGKSRNSSAGLLEPVSSEQPPPLPEAIFLMLATGAVAGLARFFARRYFLESRPRRRTLRL